MELILEAIVRSIIYEFVLYSFSQLAILKLKRKNIFPYFNQNNFGLGLLSYANLDLNVIHKSENYLILNKSFDLLINSDKPNVKVSKDIKEFLVHLTSNSLISNIKSNPCTSLGPNSYQYEI